MMSVSGTSGIFNFEGEQTDLVEMEREPGGQGVLGDKDITMPVYMGRASSSLQLSQLTNRNHLQPEATINRIHPHSFNSTSLPPHPPPQQDLAPISGSRPTQSSLIQGLEVESKDEAVGSSNPTSIQSYLEQLEQNISIRHITAEAQKVRIIVLFRGKEKGFLTTKLSSCFHI